MKSFSVVLGRKKVKKINNYLFINTEITSNSFFKVIVTTEKMQRKCGKNAAKNKKKFHNLLQETTELFKIFFAASENAGPKNSVHCTRK